MFLRLLILSGAIVCVAFAPAPWPRKERQKQLALLQRMQGWWAHTAEVQDGRPSGLFGLRIHVEGDTLQYYVGQNKADGWTIKVDPSARPATLDKTRLGTKDDVLLGRVSVEGDVMKIAWLSNTDRPDDVDGARGRAITLKRER